MTIALCLTAILSWLSFCLLRVYIELLVGREYDRTFPYQRFQTISKIVCILGRELTCLIILLQLWKQLR